MPLPRFWYFPRGEQGGRRHDRRRPRGAAGPRGATTVARAAARRAARSPTGSACAPPPAATRATPLTDAQAAAYQARASSSALHLNTECQDFTARLAARRLRGPAGRVPATFPGVGGARAPTGRTASPGATGRPRRRWSASRDPARHELLLLARQLGPEPARHLHRLGHSHALRRLDGSLIDVYQATTQMTNESDITSPRTSQALLDRALGPEGYYGAFTANMHSDRTVTPAPRRSSPPPRRAESP